MPVDDTLRCQVCQSPHPGGFPKVYLELHHFLEEKFPTEYALRKCTAQLKEAHLQQESQTTSTCMFRCFICSLFIFITDVDICR